MKDTGKALASFRKALRAARDPERAGNQKRYLKSPFKFFGVRVPFVGSMAKDFRKANRDAGRAEIFEIARELWNSEYHEEKTLAVKLLEQYPELLVADAMPMLERMLSEATGWDHVDGIAIHLVGEVLRKDKRALAHLSRWGTSDNFWMRRSALISQILLLRQGKGDKDLFFRLARGMTEEEEFFIRKAIGWTLRELSKADPDAVFRFLMDVRDTASSVTVREGLRRLPAHQKEMILG